MNLQKPQFDNYSEFSLRKQTVQIVAVLFAFFSYQKPAETN